MLRLRVRSEVQNRAKNGQPPHSTTGVASASCTQTAVRIGSSSQPSNSMPTTSSASGTVNTALPHKRRVMSMSSGLGPSSRDDSSGSSAMPQIGQLPGASRRICGCIGQVQIVPAAASGGTPLAGCATAGPRPAGAR